MSEHLAKLQNAKHPHDDEDESQLNDHEQAALEKIRSEAKAAGATLATNGKGGLPPSMVLGCMRRDAYTCKMCSGKKDLTVHHKAHLDNPSPKMVRFGKKVDQRNDKNAIVTVCEACHAAEHDRDRENVEGN